MDTHEKEDDGDGDADEDKDADDGEDDDDEDDEVDEDDGWKDACVTVKQGLPHSTAASCCLPPSYYTPDNKYQTHA